MTSLLLFFLLPLVSFLPAEIVHVLYAPFSIVNIAVEVHQFLNAQRISLYPDTAHICRSHTYTYERIGKPVLMQYAK